MDREAVSKLLFAPQPEARSDGVRLIETRQYDEVTQIKLSRETDGKPYYWVAAYLVDGLLIDTGCSHTAEELVDFLAERDLKLVVNTHYHEDHVGADALLQDKLGVEVFAHHESIQLIKDPPRLSPYREFKWGRPKPAEVQALNGYMETRNFRFEVIETPGHCPGHVTLVELSKGWCFTGDLYLGQRLKIAGPENDMDAMVASMRRLMELNTDRLILFTALRLIEKNGRDALRKSIQWLENLAYSVKKMDEKGMPVQEIVDELFGGESVFHRLTGGLFSCSNMIRLILNSQMR